MRVFLEIVVGERRDLDAPLAQRRHVEADDVQAVEEVFAEPALRDERVEVDVGGGDHAHVRLDRLHFANRMHLVRVEEPKQLRLDFERRLADFVEEQRATASGANHAREVLGGAGE